ncbi:MAG: serine/threonine-protein kinase [Gemmataceae bacterium]
MRTTLSLHSLRDYHLLDDSQVARLASSWQGRLCPLVEAGLLTRYQARQIARGRLQRLRLGPYLLQERLGRGAEAVVYKAHHVFLNRTVALKIHRLDQISALSLPSLHARFSHPHLVQILDAWRHRRRLILALEYIQGVDLSRLLAESGPLPIPLVEAVARQVASALAYLHAQGWVHRDVKPANLLLVPDADLPLIKLIDMGLSCRAGEETVCGSPDYLAPERGLGDPVDVRSDLYALGCTLYELLTGRVPFPGGDPLGKLLRHRLEEPEPIHRLRPDTPAPMVELINRLMQRDPECRIGDPRQVATILDHPPLRATVPTRNRRLWPWMIAVLIGLAMGGLVRLGLKLPASVATATPPAAAPLDLQRAFAQAPPGAIITLHEPGPYLVGSLQRDQPLTVQAAPGVHPCLMRANADAEKPLIQATADLTLRGLALHDESDQPLILFRKAARLTLRSCTLDARRQAIKVEVADTGRQHLDLIDCEVCVRQPDGAALLLGQREFERAAEVQLLLRGTTIESGRILALQSVRSPITIEQSACRLLYRQDRISYSGSLDSSQHVVNWSIK